VDLGTGVLIPETGLSGINGVTESNLAEYQADAGGSNPPLSITPSGDGYYHPPRVVNIKLMTALHIRKNVREFFPWAASLPGTAVKVCKQWQPDEQTIKNAIYSSRVSIATFFNHIH
jgi:hypothetical protein